MVALFLVGGATISSFAEAQSPVYTTTTVVAMNEINSLQQQINSMHNRVSTLEREMREVQNRPRPVTVVAPTYPTIPNTGVTWPPAQTTTTYPVVEPVMTNSARVVIDQNGGTFTQGWNIYFTGRGFSPNEQILITRNGSVVGRATIDGAGGFAASGVFLPLGTHTFVFTGQNSSVSAVASVQGATSVIP